MTTYTDSLNYQAPCESPDAILADESATPTQSGWWVFFVSAILHTLVLVIALHIKLQSNQPSATQPTALSINFALAAKPVVTSNPSSSISKPSEPEPIQTPLSEPINTPAKASKVLATEAPSSWAMSEVPEETLIEPESVTTADSQEAKTIEPDFVKEPETAPEPLPIPSPTPEPVIAPTPEEAPSRPQDTMDNIEQRFPTTSNTQTAESTFAADSISNEIEDSVDSALNPDPGQTIWERKRIDFEQQIGEHLRYPALALKQGLQGQVQLEVFFAEDGEVDDIQVVGSSGHSTLDKAALKSAKKALRKQQDTTLAGDSIIVTLIFQLT